MLLSRLASSYSNSNAPTSPSVPIGPAIIAVGAAQFGKRRIYRQAINRWAVRTELVQNKLDARPVTIIRGYVPQTDTPAGTGRDLVMPPERDLYR